MQEMTTVVTRGLIYILLCSCFAKRSVTLKTKELCWNGSKKSDHWGFSLKLSLTIQICILFGTAVPISVLRWGILQVRGAFQGPDNTPDSTVSHSTPCLQHLVAPFIACLAKRCSECLSELCSWPWLALHSSLITISHCFVLSRGDAKSWPRIFLMRQLPWPGNLEMVRSPSSRNCIYVKGQESSSLPHLYDTWESGNRTAQSSHPSPSQIRLWL